MIKPLYTIMIEETPPQKFIPRLTPDRIIEDEEKKKGLIETFTNQLYAYFLRKQEQEGEYN